ncbi:hypothetical protein QZH56_18995 [Streptomyces olivoreticuli]|uniref:hypothetical protein n=1 Tax=Streptomyces olivoreticuli TaxID=68246 RepID=UPI0026583F8A|nr:hypothetical protein [Streptomyces olivoreticuli]WKK20981.1 hypothetical protein QZH56_18995 [Streptomyces olivoreticuli]
MRDVIARLLTWVLRMLLPAHGRHSGTRPSTAQTPPTPPPYVICGPRKPTPPHVLARTMPIPEGTRPLVPLFIQEWIKQEEERERQRERCLAAVAASMGYDYPNPETFDRVRVAVSA